MVIWANKPTPQPPPCGGFLLALTNQRIPHSIRSPASTQMKPPLSLRNKALQFLSKREYSRAELAGKLRLQLDPEQLEAQQAELQQILDDFEQRGWLSDERFAEQWTHFRSQRYGPGRLKQELRQKGVASVLIEQSLEQVADQEEATARRLWQKKFGQPPQDAKERAKQLRFLASRGFSTGVIYKVVQGGGMDEDDMDFAPDFD